MQTHATATPELVKDALAHISPDCPRDEWARIAAALKSEWDGEEGFALFRDWSETGAAFDEKDCRSTWKSLKAQGAVKLGTLFHIAQQNGFKFPKSSELPAAPSPAEIERRQAERARAIEAEAARTAAAHAAVAAEATALWQAAAEAVTHPYLTKKGIRAHGTRVAADGALLVPVRTPAGELVNVQRILPNANSDKRFLKGGRKAGCMAWLGQPEGAAVMAVCEGFATAASVHEATGLPVATAFDAGSLLAVAEALRAQHPEALIVLAGDDDAGTAAQKGRNPGREKAEAAARAVQGLAIFPQDLPEGGSDFNDAHVAHGLEAVRTTVLAAIHAHQQAPAAAQAPKATKTRKAAPMLDESPAQAADRFRLEESGDRAGLWYTPPGDDIPRRVCDPLHVVARAFDAHGNQAALLLQFDTPTHKGRRWMMPLAMLAGDGAAYRSALLSLGFMAPTDGKRRAWLTEYLQSRQPDELVRHVPRVGWHGRCYVLPDETLGESLSGEKIIFHSEVGMEANFARRGTLDRWQQDLARLCVKNSRMAFAVSTALAGPLLAWAPGTTGGGFHFVGNTSTGKTTGFLVAASVWGKGVEKEPDSFVQKWRATSNGLESQCEQHNDCTMILDELGQMESGDAGASVYMIADGQGKTRAKGMGGMRPKASWRLLFLSSGEMSLEQQMRDAGKKMKGGQEVRLIPIPAEVRPGSAMEYLHEFDHGHELSGWVAQHGARHYGTAGRAWLEHLVSRTDTLPADLQSRMEAIERALVPTDAAGQVRRAGRRFALVAAAGEMAREAGILPWPEGEAIRAAKACFDAWIASRGGAGSSEVSAMLRQVRLFFAAHGDGRFQWWHRSLDDRAGKVLHRAGFRRQVGPDGTPIKSDSDHVREYGPRPSEDDLSKTRTEFFVLPDVFKGEICASFDYREVCRLLLERNCLRPDAGRSFDAKVRLPGLGNTWCYRITPEIFELEDV